MDVEQALNEAKRRWGPDACICSGTRPRERCQVGAPVKGGFQILGRGRTWADALEDAEHRGGGVEREAREATG